jgi:glycolate oxidase FAD binding subunit
MGEIETFITELQDRIPGIDATTSTDELYNHPVDGILPRAIVTPSTVEDAAQVVAQVHEQHLTVLPRGGGSHMNLGGLADWIDILLTTHRLTRLLEHEGPDLTCHVEAGITLGALQTQLVTKGQRLALDPPEAEETTIGGMLATNASGPKRLRYGTARDMIIGLRVIQANGEIARSGGRVVKNVAGYDLNKLYIGSLGTLGIIVEANFKLQPIPPAERTLLLTFANVEDAMHTVIAITGSLLTPSSLELLDAGAASDMTDLFGLHLPANGYTLAVDFEGNITTIERQIDETRLLARQHNALMGNDLNGEDQTRFWDAVRTHTQGSLTCKVSLPVSQVAHYLQQLERICRSHDIEAATIAHAGNGILYIELRPSDAISRMVEAIAELRAQAQATRGSLVAERCPVELKRRISVWGEPGNNFQMMRQLKQQFDPQGTFVSGRFLGGL